MFIHDYRGEIELPKHSHKEMCLDPILKLMPIKGNTILAQLAPI